LEHASPLDALKSLMEERNLRQADLLPVFGSRSVASDVLELASAALARPTRVVWPSSFTSLQACSSESDHYAVPVTARIALTKRVAFLDGLILRVRNGSAIVGCELGETLRVHRSRYRPRCALPGMGVGLPSRSDAPIVRLGHVEAPAGKGVGAHVAARS